MSIESLLVLGDPRGAVHLHPPAGAVMASSSDLTIRIKAVDEASPVIRRISHQFWWMQHGALAVTLLWVATLALSFALGLLAARYIL